MIVIHDDNYYYNLRDEFRAHRCMIVGQYEWMDGKFHKDFEKWLLDTVGCHAVHTSLHFPNHIDATALMLRLP